jgi:hypothetical protein
MTDYKSKKIVILRKAGDTNSGTLPDGRKVYRKEKIYIPEYGKEIPCAGYDDHFIYEAPVDLVGSTFRCSCGSIAVISGYSAYAYGASPSGLMLICQEHALTQQHLTGGSRWI